MLVPWHEIDLDVVVLLCTSKRVSDLELSSEMPHAIIRDQQAIKLAEARDASAVQMLLRLCYIKRGFQTIEW